MCWKGKQTNFQDILDFIDNNKNSKKLKEFEDRLADTSLLDFRIYECRFKQKKTFYQISKKMDMPTAYISKSLESISLAFQIFLL